MEFPLIGNKNVQTVLENAFLTGHIPHAIIIEGENGCGKHTLANFIAKSCVCKGASAPCNACRECYLADAGSHPDIRIIEPQDKKKNIDIAQIRALKAEAYSVPQRAKRRVFLISKAETMNQNSANALLKVLEEPPGGAVFVLITAYSASLLPTVRSRCVTFSLVPPILADAKSFLKQHTKASDEKIAEVLAVSTNIGRALKALGSKKSGLGESVADEFFESLLKGDSYNMSVCLGRLEKNRAAADEFFMLLSQKTAEQIKVNALKSADNKKLYKVIKAIKDTENLSAYNISLPLLFSQFCSNINLEDI